jgi:hypothetical protein
MGRDERSSQQELKETRSEDLHINYLQHIYIVYTLVLLLISSLKSFNKHPLLRNTINWWFCQHAGEKVQNQLHHVLILYT